MRKISITASVCLLIILGGMLSTFSSRLFAADLSQFQAGNIIGDLVFTNNNSMSAAEIQNFFIQRNAVCLKDFRSLSLYDDNNDGIVQDSTSEQYGPETMSAAEIIKAAADIYKINPKVIITTLQKEQGLITTTDCASWKYNTALGYGCPDTAPCDQSAYGFTRQIDYGTYHFRGFIDDSLPSVPYSTGNEDIFWHPDTSRCGSSTISIENRATVALYSYTPYRPNQASLDAGYGLGDSCSSYGNRNFYNYFTDWFGSTLTDEVFVSYKSHIHELGWIDTVKNNGITGTTGQSRAMQAIKINGDVEYSTYSYSTGWQPTVNRGMISGTTKMNRPIQAIRINPMNPLSDKYDFYYRTHISNVGWQGWAKNGQPAGVTGDVNKNIEAIEIRLITKGYAAPGSTIGSYQNISTTTYSPPLQVQIASHVGTVGWQPTVVDTMVSGTTEQRKRIEALRLNLVNNTGIAGSIFYSAHLAGIGWQEYKKDNETAGTTGQSRQMEAVRISLSSNLKDNYDIWYRGYVQTKGWLGWTKNGYPAGSIGAGLQLEAVEVRLAAKNSLNIGGSSLFNPKSKQLPDSYQLRYSAHISNMGWANTVNQGSVAGTTGQSKPIEAIRITHVSSLYGLSDITCSAYVRETGWTDFLPINNICGTTGQSKPIEGLRLQLIDELAKEYTISYRVHVSNIGWQAWQTEGAIAGTPGVGKSIEAVVINLNEK